MRLLVLLLLLVPFSSMAQQVAFNGRGGIGNGLGQGNDHKRSVTAQGAVIIPALMNVSSQLLNSRRAVFNTWEDINNGITIPGYASVNVSSSRPWVLYARIDYTARVGKDAITYSVRERSQRAFTVLSDVPEPVLRSTNDNLVNSHSFDIRMETDYKRFVPGDYNVNLVFTISPQ